MTHKARGRDLRTERVKAGVTQGAMASALAMHRNDLSRVENEWIPFDEEFAKRYRATLNELAKAGERV